MKPKHLVQILRHNKGGHKPIIYEGRVKCSECDSYADPWEKGKKNPTEILNSLFTSSCKEAVVFNIIER